MSLSGVLARHGVPDTARSVNSKAATTSLGRGGAEVVEGLAEWLALLNLDAYEPAVAAWASDMGAVVLEEIVENISDLRMAVPFKRLESKRLEQHGLEAAHMLLYGTNHAEPEDVGLCPSQEEDDAWNAAPTSSMQAGIRQAPNMLVAGKGPASVVQPKTITSRGAPKEAKASSGSRKGASKSSDVAPLPSKGDDASMHAGKAPGLTAGDASDEEALQKRCLRQWLPPAAGSNDSKQQRKGRPLDTDAALKAQVPGTLEDDVCSARAAPRRWQGQASATGRGKGSNMRGFKGAAGKDGLSKNRDAQHKGQQKKGGPEVHLVTLRVDVKCGAGLELVWLPREGFEVSEIDDFPGQPELIVGDLIVAINGVKLDATSEEEAQQRFGGEFCDEAELEIYRDHRDARVSRKGAGSEAAQMSDAVSVLEVTLRLAAGVGAGLELVWFPPEGFLVEAVDDKPGQPDLRAGDIIRGVGGIGLGGFPSETAAEDTLKNVLRNGAIACVYRPRAHARMGDMVAVVASVSDDKEATPMLIPSIGIGTWSWGHESWGYGSWGCAQEGPQSYMDAFAGAVHRGAFLFDSAPTYGRGLAQSLLGRCRQEGHYAVTATKFYPGENVRDLAASMVSSAQASIAQLQSPKIDLFQLHKPASPPTSLEAQADALAAVVHAGLAKAVGVCNFSLDELRAVRDRLQSAHGLPLSTCQVELSLARQLPIASGLLDACRSMGIVVLAYSPLAMGRLSGKYDPRQGGGRPRWGPRGDQRRPFGAALDEDATAMGALIDALSRMGQRYGGRSVAQVALNWVIAQGAVAIAGAKNRSQAEENAGAMGWRLSAADVRELTSLGARGAVTEFQHG